MKYKFAPLYKYLLYFVIVYMFFKHQKNYTIEKILSNTISLTFIIISLDYLLIDDHPCPTGNCNSDDIPDDNIDIDDIYEDEIEEIDNRSIITKKIAHDPENEFDNMVMRQSQNNDYNNSYDNHHYDTGMMAYNS